MIEWILVLHVYAMYSPAVALTTVGSFPTKAQCEQAGVASSKLVSGTRKDFKYVCIAGKKL